ncbi:MAG: (2Fe-2S) ferredoxin domain-containing protein [Clostridia bacterium]|nr:(2Fe-2S) ferredoxin domain-containing protein [Clostridia bacterium]
MYIDEEDDVMRITVCIGSSCHIKGSRQVVQGLQQLIAENGLQDRVDLGGTFCMGNCQAGVCVTVDDVMYSVTPDTVEKFFDEHVKGKA